MAGRPRRALLTGGTGFIGSHLAHKLVQEGWHVSVTARKSSDLARLETILPRLTMIALEDPTKTLVSQIQAAPPDIVFHLAATSIPSRLPADIEQMVRANVLLGSQILESCIQSGVRHFINTGSFWQYCSGDSYSPYDFYASTKQAFEAVVDYYCGGHGLTALTLFLFDNFGHRDPRPKIFNLLRSAAQECRPLGMTPGQQKVNLLFIDDVVAAYLMAADLAFAGRPGIHSRYQIGADHLVSLREAVESFLEISGSKVDIHWGERPYNVKQIMEPSLPFPRLPNWTPKYSLKEGLSRMAELSGKEKS